MKRTRLTLDLVKTLLTTVRPGLAVFIKDVKTVPDLQREVAQYVEAQGAITAPPALSLDPEKLYTARLQHTGPNVINVIKTIREFTGASLADSKAMVDAVRYNGIETPISREISAPTCQRYYERFCAAGARLSFTEVA